jgi:three-Cys-motif partner protein
VARKEHDPTHRFGGDWTTRKLDVVAGYLRGYTTALKNTPFQKLYIDAFAGTGYRTMKKDKAGDSESEKLFSDLAETEPQALLDGSARIALQTDPPFDRYLFIERNADRCASLKDLQKEFPDLASRIDVRQDDANVAIRSICNAGDWRMQRAVLFLDPYGMQVEWSTIEAIAGTKAIDLWLLFPLGMGVNRLLTKSGDIPEPWRRRLDLMLGKKDWFDAFYKAKSSSTLFGEEEDLIKAKTDTIGRYFNDRLNDVFKGGTAQPGVLWNSRNSPLYLLCFAVGNPHDRAKEIALRIANHMLEEVR